MSVRNKPYEQFGPYILFKKLESDALSELWRAGRLDGTVLATGIALRRFTGGQREALVRCVTAVKPILPQLTGTTFVRNQTCDVLDGVPYLAYESSGGRSLRHIIDRARGAGGSAPNPVPIEQALAIMERIALSLVTMNEMKIAGKRLSHGALIPQFIWITDDGEIRVAGQQLGPALVASMGDPAVAAEISRYFPPDLQQSGVASKTSEVYAAGALLYLLVTGSEPPDAISSSAFHQTVRAARTMSGATMPAEIRSILEKSLTLDPAARYASIAEMKQAIALLISGGAFSATTFNLAFYVSTLLKKELEAEAGERERESKVTIAPFLADLQPAAPPAPLETAPRAHAAGTPKKKSGIGITLAAAAAAAFVVAGGTIMLTSHRSGAAAAPVRVAHPQPPRTRLVSQPLVASATPPGGPVSPAPPVDDAARKKAFEDAVEAKLQEEMMKLQRDYTQKLQQQQSKQAPVQAALLPPVTKPHADDPAPSAAQLDQQRLAARQEVIPSATAPQAVPPVTTAPSQPATPAVDTAATAEPIVHEGDIVDVAAVDAVPHVIRAAAPMYPPMAMRQKAEATILITALISESGDVIDARVLRGDKRFGFEEAALRAVRATRFSPATKDGKRVKTWFPVPVSFKL